MLQKKKKKGKIITPKKAIKKELDSLWSKAVRLPGKCAVCSSTNRLNAHHIFGKGAFKALRWDVENGLCLCVYHHLFSNKSSPHRGSVGFQKWLDENKDLTRLELRKRNRPNMDMFSLEMKKKELELLLKK